MSCRTAMWFYSVLTSDSRAPRRRTALVCLALALALLGGCGQAASARAPESSDIEWRLSGSFERLAAELVDSGGMSNVFKLTYEEMTNNYELDISLFDRITVYTPGAGDDPNALFFGRVNTHADLPAAKQELERQLELLRAASPDGVALQNAQTVVHGRYILLVAAADNAPPVALLEHRLRKDTFTAQ